ncbi:hypothetical protein L484_015802 [Morus notabilis]|uniref:Uncharacterized protein n=1 Tax=Morus notabilis TaxID=981085 RepID=W9RDU6_9ROSA|nr:hypothetical protein L484_015802 [Morus notabilis]
MMVKVNGQPSKSMVVVNGQLWPWPDGLGQPNPNPESGPHTPQLWASAQRLHSWGPLGGKGRPSGPPVPTVAAVGRGSSSPARPDVPQWRRQQTQCPDSISPAAKKSAAGQFS